MGNNRLEVWGEGLEKLVVNRRDFFKIAGAAVVGGDIFNISPFGAAVAEEVAAKKERITQLRFAPGMHFLSIGDYPDRIEQVMGGRNHEGRFNLLKEVGPIPIACDVCDRNTDESQMNNYVNLIAGLGTKRNWLRVDYNSVAGETLPGDVSELVEYAELVLRRVDYLLQQGVDLEVVILGNEADLVDNGQGGVRAAEVIDYPMIVKTVNLIAGLLAVRGIVVALPAFSAGPVPDGGDPEQIFEDYNILHLGSLLDAFDNLGGLPANVVPSFHSYLWIQTRRVPNIFNHPRIASRVEGRTPVGTEIGAHEWDWGKSYQNQHPKYYDLFMATGYPYVMWNAWAPENAGGDTALYSLLTSEAGRKELGYIFKDFFNRENKV